MKPLNMNNVSRTPIDQIRPNPRNAREHSSEQIAQLRPQHRDIRVHSPDPDRRIWGHWSTFIVWGKDRFTLGRSDYQRQFEPLLYGWKEGQSHFWCGARNEGDLWCVPKPKSNRLHPTMKPVALAERAIRNSSRRGDLVLDVFAGAGSTLVACEKASRRAAVVELDLKYADVIIRRWEAYTHREAMLADDGRSFSAITTERARRAA